MKKQGGLMLRKARQKGVDIWIAEEIQHLIDQRALIHMLDQAIQGEPVVWDVGNVVDYLSGIGYEKRIDLTVRDLPCVVPPHELLWIEFEVPTVGDWFLFQQWQADIQRVGVLVRTYDFNHKDLGSKFVEMFQNSAPDIFTDKGETTPRFGIDASFFVDRKSPQHDHIPTTVQGPHFQIVTAVDSQGTFNCFSEGRSKINTKILSAAFVDYLGKIPDPEIATFVRQVLVRDVMLPVWFAISLTHCKNVREVEQTGRFASRQERRLAERKGELPPDKYYTLEIGSISRSLNEEGKAQSDGLKKALHICRGHFSTYSEEKPLFGKYAGRFWVPAHVRGSADAGRVVKDYSVKAPRSDAA